MTAADRVQEAPRPGHGAPGRHSAYGAEQRRPAGRRPTAWVVAPSVCSAVLAAAAIFIVLNGAHSAGYHIGGGTMTAVWVLVGLIVAVVVATLAFAGRPGRAEETRIPAFGESGLRQAPPMAPPQQQAQPRPQPQAPQGPGPRPQQMPPAPPAPPAAAHVVANATEAAATLAAATKAAAGPAPISDEGVDLQVIFAQLVRRLLTLVLQQINRLDELENEVEDPKLLKSLFGIDHQATQVRRYGENIGVLVGALPQRQWTHPVPVTVAQRSAVSETPDYPRVQVIPRAPGRIHGHAVSDVIHILSELVENATNYSNPTTKVTVGAHRVSAGLAIEINDHGIGMESEQFQRLNTLLRDPSGANVRDLLSQGRIGLSVVAKMAQRHGIAVELAPNVTGGTMALVVIPDALLAPEELPADKGHQPRRGVDHTQLPARPALASLPLPDTLPPATASAAPGPLSMAGPAGTVPAALSPVAPVAPMSPAAPNSAASLSPVTASTPPPLSSPATAHVPPLPSASAPSSSGAHASPLPSRTATDVPPLPSSPAAAAAAAQEVSRPAPPSALRPTAPVPSRPVAPAPSAPGYAQPDYTQPSYQQSSYQQTDYSSGYSQPSHARQVPAPPPAPQRPAEPQWPSTTPPMTTDAPAPSQGSSLPGPTGSVAPYASPSADQSTGGSVPPWSRPGEHTPEPAPGRLPDGRPQLRRRIPQGHISARLIQDEAQESRHGTGALSPTMMSDFWQGLSSGTAPADPPAAGPDPSQHDRTTANRQEWNQ
ncbi:putative RDD family membrane protein YckC [Catenulispora sp. GP43]|uniref:sensor histidine kinase n=1 Tax=Catenulispora sp. GP43 TaxID=3156263 RepID=UPI00351829B2